MHRPRWSKKTTVCPVSNVLRSRGSNVVMRGRNIRREGKGACTCATHANDVTYEWRETRGVGFYDNRNRRTRDRLNSNDPAYDNASCTELEFYRYSDREEAIFLVKWISRWFVSETTWYCRKIEREDGRVLFEIFLFFWERGGKDDVSNYISSVTVGSKI